MLYNNLFKYIDHSILKPTISITDIENGVDMAIKNEVASICIMPCHAEFCVKTIQMENSKVIPSTVIGFPLGLDTLKNKIEQCVEMCKYGIKELDIVCNINNVVNECWEQVRTEIRELYAIIKTYDLFGVKMKVIFETCYLTEYQKISLCDICSQIMDHGWVKTSTGFGTHGATVDDIKLMRKYTSYNLQVKASGGIRNVNTIEKMLENGATRIGCSLNGKLIEEIKEYNAKNHFKLVNFIADEKLI